MRIANNILNWQENIYKDADENQLATNENLINAVLEVAYQIALFREELKPILLRPQEQLSRLSVEVENMPRIADKYLDKDGAIDLSKLTGEEAREYFISVLGINIPINGVVKRKPL